MFRLLFLGFFLVAQPLFAASFANAQFVMDIPAKEFRDKANVFILSDLSIGETGLMRDNLCLIGHELFIRKSQNLESTKTDYSLNFLAKREPNNMISLTVSNGKDSDYKIQDYLNRLAIQTTVNCIDSNVDETYFKIKSINGVTKLSDLFNTELQ